MYSARADGPAAGAGALSGRFSSSQSAYMRRGASSSGLAQIAASSAAWSLIGELHDPVARAPEALPGARGNAVPGQPQVFHRRQRVGLRERGRVRDPVAQRVEVLELLQVR